MININQMDEIIENSHPESTSTTFTSDEEYEYGDYGGSFMPPAYWDPPSVRPHTSLFLTLQLPPICMTETACPVCPIFTAGSTIDFNEWMA